MSERDEVIAGRYRLVDQVGRGATGVVWRARDERLGRVVAIKFLGAGSPADAVERIVREGRVAARLRHPHAVTVHDVIEHGGKPCLVMEYLPSRTLAELVDERGPLPEELVAGVGWQVASALAAAHAVGVVHRDVTTFNVLLGEDGTAKIADFGIARAIGEGTVTDPRVVVGTPAFLAPEVAAGEQAVFASDVYSLGATLYAALEGHPPFGTIDDNPYALLRRVSEGQVAPLRFPGPLGEVLLRVLRRDPGERPTMAEVHALLGAVVSGRHPVEDVPADDAPTGDAPPVDQAPPVDDLGPPGTTLPIPAPSSAPSSAPSRRSRRRIALLAGAAVLVAGGIAIGASLRGDAPSNDALPAPTTTTTTPPVPDCTARFEIVNSWPGGYQVRVVVRNAGRRALTEWTVTWLQPAGHAISRLWDGNLRADAGSVRVTSADYNATLPVDGSTSFGFTANGPATPQPDMTCTSDG
ncbi:serine/threonine-protein kinase [Saccharothrix syringae]|uniref:non-specific serine/threonine protein kinase n=1 Tax=Saccharothrix syringae TaxID=103733 RepID=A0A5Q0H4U0_SACSY|nr:serine/threonine-protein kinase [Saccharothrix syringae]QFZ21271.1 serine/threonine protein kinase [Saccharothrix syringae]